MASQTCCCGRLSLRGGSIAVGVLLTTTSIAATAVSLAALVCLQLDVAPWLPVPPKTATVLLTISAVHLVFSVVLLRGALSSNRDLMLAWVIFAGLLVILQIMGLVVAVALAVVEGVAAPECAVLAAGAVWTLLFGYCFRVVLDYLVELNVLLNKRLNSGAADKDDKVVLVYQVQRV